jgi:hypothetical protein
MSIQNSIIEFLLTLDLSTSPKREALLIRASLDQELANSVDCSVAAAEFVPLLVSAAAHYGELQNGQDALEGILLVARKQVGVDRKAVCNSLINEWLSLQVNPATNREDNYDNQQGYTYDVFLSYGHSSIFDTWVNQVFFHRLEGYLREFLPRPVKIRRAEVSTTDHVTTYTKIALVQSRCLVAICSPTYFRSPRRVYEMSVMLHREQRLGYQTEHRPTPLILPVFAFDGDCFPDVVLQRDLRCDCNGLTSMSIEYSERGVMLDDKIIQFALGVANTINNAPPWEESFYDDLNPPPNIENSLESSDHFIALPRW